MFGKFMNKKFFHPGSYPNIRRKWIAEQKALEKEKKEQDMKEQYNKEQSTYQNKMLITKKEEDKIKLGLNFMYELPPGMKLDNQNSEKDSSEGKEEVKFEWQKKAPRAGYTKNLGLDVHDQPFGVCVRNVKCFKCGKWGHQNVDKECPLFNEKAAAASEGASKLDSLCLSDPLRLIEDMKREHGLTLRKSVIGKEIDPMAENQQILDSDDDNVDPDVAYVESLTNKQKKKLLRKLEKLEKKKQEKSKRKKDKRSKQNELSNNPKESISEPRDSHRKGRRHDRDGEKHLSLHTSDKERMKWKSNRKDSEYYSSRRKREIKSRDRYQKKIRK